MDETCEMLRTVWGTSNARTLPLSATGSAGMEAAFVNTVHPGDVVVVAVNGLFGQRMTDVAARCGAEVVAVEHEWGQPVDVDRVLAAHAVAGDHRRRPRRDLDRRALRHRRARARGKGDALLLADAVTSIAGIELRADDWGVDIGYAGTQKCLGVAPGLAPVHHQRPRLRAPRREAALVVPRPRHARRLRRRGGRSGGPADLPPHRAHRDGRQPPRRAHPHPRRGPRRRLGPPPGRRRRAPGRAGGDGPRAVRRRGQPAPRADHREGARRASTPPPCAASCWSGTASRSAPAPARTPPASGASG